MIQFFLNIYNIYIYLSIMTNLMPHLMQKFTSIVVKKKN